MKCSCLPAGNSKKTFETTDFTGYTDFEIIELHRLEACATKFSHFGGTGILPVLGNMLCFLLVLLQQCVRPPRALHAIGSTALRSSRPPAAGRNEKAQRLARFFVPVRWSNLLCFTLFSFSNNQDVGADALLQG